jgi:oligosaccharide translocation protein RFT1
MFKVSQALEKLVLAEGTKIAMTKVQSAYDQGVYGLVVNLGSIAARMLLQPFEEAAFMSFSQPVPAGGASRDQIARLVPLVKVAILFGK